jgi:SAM-dependent methyltransferase
MASNTASKQLSKISNLSRKNKTKMYHQLIYENMRELMKEINRRIDKVIGPDQLDRIKIYKSILSEIEFDSVLHLGSGRDKRDLISNLKQDGGEIVALDPDKQGLLNNSVTNKILGDGQKLPFRRNKFDLVFSEYVFEHLPNPQSALEEINRILKPGGSFVVLVPNPAHYYARIANMTPFWFHKVWLKIMGFDTVEEDTFPTTYEWGSYDDVRQPNQSWSIEKLVSIPGPTGYTKILPIHCLFTLVDRILEDHPRYHLVYIVHYKKKDAC